MTTTVTSAFILNALQARELQLDRGQVAEYASTAIALLSSELYVSDQPLDFRAAFLLQHAEGGSGNSCYQAIALIDWTGRGRD